ncbi:Arabinogalactan peptide 22 [Ananas comosus]|uniref:Arabinogalactan peptide 22 n=1 Tax=Ananas comosus TaxID=4615 RepID=A0A199VBB9_ANACO|nr:Arabinogalactan peptide 22 [Ananas comosus]
MSSMRAYALFIIAVAFMSGLTQLAHGHAEAAAAAVVPKHRIDSNAIDQGIAYVLMLVALLVTYFVH